jgi:hypothetical protein
MRLSDGMLAIAAGGHHRPIDISGSDEVAQMGRVVEVGSLNSTHVHGTHVPVQEPSTASQAGIMAWHLLNHLIGERRLADRWRA